MGNLKNDFVFGASNFSGHDAQTVVVVRALSPDDPADLPEIRELLQDDLVGTMLEKRKLTLAPAAAWELSLGPERRVLDVKRASHEEPYFEHLGATPRALTDAWRKWEDSHVRDDDPSDMPVLTPNRWKGRFGRGLRVALPLRNGEVQQMVLRAVEDAHTPSAAYVARIEHWAERRLQPQPNLRKAFAQRIKPLKDQAWFLGGLTAVFVPAADAEG